MPRLNLNVDEAQLLKTYGLSSLNPTKWEDVDHDLEESVAASILNPDREREGDPLGLPHALDMKELNMETKAAIVISSKTFDPSTYLSVVHPEATYHDFAAGIVHLQKSLEARSQALRILVEDNFDRFIAVKTTTEGLQEDMKSAILSKETDFSSKPLRDHLKLGVQKANQIFIPVLDSASKARKLSTTLSVFQRSRFFFNLPGFIMESIDAGRYDVAIRDYKKGKYMLENRPSQLLPIGPTKDEQQRQKRILNKVWGSVEKAMGEMKRVLETQLQESNRSVEEHEKTLETLMEFQSSDDPLWTYFDTQNTLIMYRMNSVYRSSAQVAEATLCDTPSSLDDTIHEKEFRNAVLLLQEGKDDTLLAKSAGEESWQAVLQLVKNVSDSIASSLHGFWAISKKFIDGKFKKPTVSSPRSPTQCRTMALEIVKLYISLISQAFMLSDVVIMTSATTSTNASATDSRPPLLSAKSHSLSTAYYLQKILGEIQECVNDVNSLEISSEIYQGLKNLVESVRWRFEDILTSDWLRDANIFYYLESWTLDPQELSVTSYLSLFELFQRHMTIAAYTIAAGSESPTTPPASSPTTLAKPHLIRRASKVTPISHTLIGKITRAFMDALYAFLDGLVMLTGEESPIVREPANMRQLKGTESAIEMRLHDLLDLKDSNVRLLLVIWNLNHLSEVVIPGMITQLEAACRVSLEEDRHTLLSVLEELDKTLFGEYVKPRSGFLVERIQDSVLGGRIDWYTAPEPKFVRRYVFEIMNHLVDIHAQVCTVAEGLLDRTINAILDEFVKEAIRCFGQITRFGTGGLLTAVMELTFIQKSLGYYGRDTAAGMKLEDLYTQQITQAYSPLSKERNFEASFEAMQRTLAEARKATLVQFLCFRRNNPKPDNPNGVEKKRSQGASGAQKRRRDKDGDKVEITNSKQHS